MTISNPQTKDLYDNALKNHEAGNTEIAKKMLRDCIKLSPEWHLPYNLLAQISNDMSVRIELLNQAILLSEDPWTYIQISLILIDLGRLSEAQNYFELCFDKFKDNIHFKKAGEDVLNALINHFFYQRQFDKIMFIFTKYLDYFDNLNSELIIKSLSFCDLKILFKNLEGKKCFFYEHIIQHLKMLNTIKKDHIDNIKIESEDFLSIKNSIYRFPSIKVNIGTKIKIVYCFNSNHFDGFIVSIFSLISNNQNILNNLEFNVFIDKSINENQKQILKTLTNIFNIIIYKIEDIVNNSDLDNLKISYGQQDKVVLDKSAYYRIYALRFLTDNIFDDYSRIIYLDCDTLIISDIIDLLSFDFYTPIAAQKDHYAELVLQSIKINNITNYFNSGLLVLNLTYRETIIKSLNECINIIENHQNKLFFHDQCALNISFNNMWTKIDDIYNMPYSYNPNAKVLHFTTAPKPWQTEFTNQIDSVYHKMWYQFNNMSYLFINSLKKHARIKYE